MSDSPYKVQRDVQIAGVFSELKAELEATRQQLQDAQQSAEEMRVMVKNQAALLERTCAKRDEYKQELAFAREDIARLEEVSARYHSGIVMAGEENRRLQSSLSQARADADKAATLVAEIGIPLEAFWMVMHDSEWLAPTVKENVQEVITKVRAFLGERAALQPAPTAEKGT